MRIMFDTNILISAVVFAGKRLTQMAIQISDEYTVVLSSRIIDELWAVINQKFPDRVSILEQFLKHLSFEMAYTPKEIDPDIYPIIRDKKDYPILASAILADVDIFITGDKDFAGLDVERPIIMTIAEFAESYL